MRRKIIDQGVRPDGRALTEVRPIWCEVGILPRTHGSRRVHPRPDPGHDRLHPRLHERCADAGRHLGAEDIKRYMHHYNMPPLFHRRSPAACAAPGRREIGHGALAERALEPMIPSRRRVPLRHPRGLRGHLLQRLDLSGFRLRLHHGADGRGRADQDARCGRAPWA